MAPSVTEESTASIQKRATKYLNELFRRSLEEIKAHYLLPVTRGLQANNNKPVKIFSASPFLKAVDPVLFPDYAKVRLG